MTIRYQGKVLIVDDDPAARKMFADFLKGRGFATVTAENALQGLRELRLGVVDLLLTDYQMPQMSGMELLLESRKILPHVPVILMSGAADLRTAVDALRNEAFDFLAKPVDSGDLLRTIDLALRRRAQATSNSMNGSENDQAGRGVGPIYCTRSKQNAEIVVLELNRPLDEHSQRAFESALRRLVGDGEIGKRVIFVLKNVNYINNVGLAFILNLYEEWKRRGIRIAFAQISDPVYKYLKMLGYLDYFPNFLNSEDASRYLG